MPEHFGYIFVKALEDDTHALGGYKMKKRIFAVLLVLSLTLSFAGSCGKNSGSEEPPDANLSSRTTSLMSGISANSVSAAALTGAENSAIAQFGLELFRRSLSDDGNTLISPLSAIYALAMTANGADGDTLAQMEAVFGLSVDELSLYLHSYIQALPESEKQTLTLANSIWFRDSERLTVYESFLQTNADYFGAEIYKAPFDDSTLSDINAWVENNTDGMIKKILERISPDAIMYLINALCFDAEWENIYKEHEVRAGEFTTESGEIQAATLMHSEEHSYIEDENATGFIKYYENRDYAFVALLPNEGVTVSDYLDSLTGESIMAMLENKQNAAVISSLPKFETEFSINMSEILAEMGITDAFDPAAADFSRMAVSDAGNIYISSVIQKTFISVNERGTRAGAATIVEASDGAAMMDYYYVQLDRPFVYMLIDTATNLPLFIGTMMSVD